ncbi:MAG: hypothetical protein GF364_10580 [Candidatus Lokiarchaeota archaeon]|nr:hypothetical protein [Candidatus Lokiarchaeota archaeon]
MDKPCVNQMELHPHFQQPDFFRFLVDRDILPVGYAPLGSPSRPERDRRKDDTTPLKDPILMEIADRLGISTAELCIKWAVQRGQIPIPMSINRDHYLKNLKVVTTKPLSKDDMKKIMKIDKNCRLIKGQVFLWENAKDWTDLWDLDGNIKQ